MDTSIPLNIIKAMNHVAVSVPDLDKAIRWCTMKYWDLMR